MTENIFAIFGTIILVTVLFVFLVGVSGMLTEQKCAPYISTIDQQKITITGLNNTITELDTNLNQCKNEYNRLITENITKKDIEDIKNEMDLTQTEINVLNQKFESINNNFINNYNTLYFYYNVSIVINIFLIVFLIGDLISVAIFKFDMKKKIIQWFASKLKLKNN